MWSFESGKMCRGKGVGFLDWVLDCVEREFKDGYIDPSVQPHDGSIADVEGKWAESQNGQFCFIKMEKEPYTSPLTLLSYSLITCGPCYGEIWVTLNGSILRAGKHTFLRWFESYLDGYD